MNLTGTQQKLLQQIVEQFNKGTKREFLWLRSHDGNSLAYGQGVSIWIDPDCDQSDFQRLAREDLIDIGRTPSGTLRGKPTAKGITFVESLKIAPTTPRKWTKQEKAEIAVTHFRGGRAKCPIDNSILAITDITGDGDTTAVIDAYCRLCGNQMESDEVRNEILAIAQSSHSTDASKGNPMPTESTSPVRIFISHSSADEPLANSLVECLLSCMVLKDDQILCTSVPGHKLPLGIDTANFLRNELNAPGVVIGLLTPNSLSAAWVMFELGAAWGAGKDIIPLLAGGAKFQDLPGPLQGRHAAMVADSLALTQAMEQISKQINATPRTSAKVASAIQRLATTGTSNTENTPRAKQVVEAHDEYMVRQLLETLHDDILRELARARKAIGLSSLGTAVRTSHQHVETAVNELKKWGFVETHARNEQMLVLLLPKGEQYAKDQRLLETKV
jgi:hypothetical protein